jgi:hypothetical protein
MTQRWRVVGASLIVILTSINAQTVSARDSDGLFAVKGVGTMECAAYLKSAAAGDEELAQYAGYLAGYISAYNEHQQDTFDLLPWQSMETLMLIMLRRCRQVPDASFAVAVTEMARFFDDHKLEKLAGRVTLGDGKSVVELYAPVAAEVRDALEKRGYPTDDLFASLQQFREDQQLPTAADNMQTVLLSLLYSSPDP